MAALRFDRRFEQAGAEQLDRANGEQGRGAPLGRLDRDASDDDLAGQAIADPDFGVWSLAGAHDRERGERRRIDRQRRDLGARVEVLRRLDDVDFEARCLELGLETTAGLGEKLVALRQRVG